MSEAKNINVLFQMCSNLMKIWNKKPVNLDECGKMLEKLKVTLVEYQIDFLPSQSSTLNIEHIVTARDTLEIGAQWAIAMKNKDLFERYMAQLKCYYLDYKSDGKLSNMNSSLMESPYKAQLLGLNLLRLLSENKLSDFHTELERLKSDDLKNSVYIKHPIQIEQYMMEGSYNKHSTSIPSRSPSIDKNTLVKRWKEIAECFEKAYERLNVQEAARMLFLDSANAAINYAKNKNWKLENNYFVFHRPERVDDLVPSTELAEKTIEYAKELEMIV
ncbi:hypothetical protein HELRODRAFT_188276 [Helobdella robusta]|uniref:26S proteasome non-ATPase regulatory subunit 8 n=1 Tax=Helobdella robusta TaxID=6412 RepID=T1FPT8_HELRO|nr:hypothetical protein HELRODRAFT_188276 [Helobdella robusta]ESO06144.1 hypothetical protein HELRODRAFT_188276 [Helobdella robusta]